MSAQSPRQRAAKQRWQEPSTTTSEVYRYCRDFQHQCDLALSPPAHTATHETFSARLEVLRAVLSSLSLFAGVCSYCVCGSGADREVELRFLMGAHGLLPLGRRLVEHMQSKSTLQQPPPPAQQQQQHNKSAGAEFADLKEAVFLARRILLVMQTHGMEGLGSMDIRTAKRLCLEWYSASLALREAAEVTATPVTDSAVLALAATSRSYATPLSAARRHARNTSLVSSTISGASSTASTTLTGSGVSNGNNNHNNNSNGNHTDNDGSGRAGPTVNSPTAVLLTLAEQTVSTATRTLAELESLFRAQTGGATTTGLENVKNSSMIGTLRDALRHHKHAVDMTRRFMGTLTRTKQQSVTRAGPVDATLSQAFWAEANAFVAAIAKLASASRTLVKDKTITKAASAGLQGLTRMTRNFAVQLATSSEQKPPNIGRDITAEQ